MNKVIFLDFDGVLRHWAGTDLNLLEARLGLPRGALFKVAFLPAFLDPAITGEITDEKWRDNVHAELETKYGCDAARLLMQGWEDAAFEIDLQLLNEIKSCMPLNKVVLTTNATSRLTNDLDAAGLDSYFHAIANSAEIGFAKPHVEFFQGALAIAKGSAADCVYVDDSPGNIEAASALGIKSELYTSSDRVLQFLKEECIY